jgi:hypothetical protein
VLPVSETMAVRVSMTLDARGLLIRDDAGKLLALVSSDGAMAESLGFTIEASRDGSRLIYTEAIESHTGCRDVVNHEDAFFWDGEKTIFLSPGEARRIFLTDLSDAPTIAAEERPSSTKAEYDLILLDASYRRQAAQSESSTLEDNCPTRAHFSWALLWVSGPSEPEPTSDAPDENP